MPSVVVGMVLLIFSAICLLVAHLTRKGDSSYKDNCKYANGIVNNILPSGGGWYEPIVLITDEFGVSQKVTCHGVKMNEEAYKSLMGATVNISYSSKTTFGVTMWDAYLNDDRFKAPRALLVVKGLTIIGAILLLGSIVLIIMGIVG